MTSAHIPPTPPTFDTDEKDALRVLREDLTAARDHLSHCDLMLDLGHLGELFDQHLYLELDLYLPKATLALPTRSMLLHVLVKPLLSHPIPRWSTAEGALDRVAEWLPGGITAELARDRFGAGWAQIVLSTWDLTALDGDLLLRLAEESHRAGLHLSDPDEWDAFDEPTLLGLSVLHDAATRLVVVDHQMSWSAVDALMGAAAARVAARVGLPVADDWLVAAAVVANLIL